MKLKVRRMEYTVFLSSRSFRYAWEGTKGDGSDGLEYLLS